MTKIISRERFVQIKFLLHIIIAAIGIVSIPLHIIFSPDPSVSITKFTIHSNIIVTIIFIISASAHVLKKPESYKLDLCKIAALIYMIVVLSIYHFILSSGGEYSGTRIITNFTLHYLTPILVGLNWLIFEEKKRYRYKSILFWLLFPVLYGVISLLRGLYDGFYPYFFLNPNDNFPAGIGSYANVAFVIVGLTFVYCLLGTLLILINRVLLRWKS
ncbi:Pr6Pr family membrane protein [Amphibacillus sp. Q70]|uniref:Pr6Pr family membrane protein n=1 Tax=Amphibacillus sp. Q70 TaxID=3453416 RepID=UPI003F827167